MRADGGGAPQGGRRGGLGGPGLERLQRGQALFGRLSPPGAPGGGATGLGARRTSGANRRSRLGRRTSPLYLPAPNKSALVGCRSSVDPATGAVAGANASGRSPSRLRGLHGLRLGLPLLP